VDGRDRAQLERLATYVLRPPLSQGRLGTTPRRTAATSLCSRPTPRFPTRYMDRARGSTPGQGCEYAQLRCERLINSARSQWDISRPASATTTRVRSQAVNQLSFRAPRASFASGVCSWSRMTCWCGCAQRQARSRLGCRAWAGCSGMCFEQAKHGLAARPPPPREFVPLGQLVLPLG
jgi:hypothetical protein